MNDLWFRVRGYVAAGVALVACPCHLLVTLPQARALAKLHQKYADRVTILALDVDLSSTPERLQKFREWVGEPDYVWAFDQGQRVARAYRVRSLDTTFIINQAGQIVYSDAYPTPYQTLEEQIRQLLG